MSKRKQRKWSRSIPIGLSLFPVVICLFLLYGPWPAFRVFLITTAMHTSEHEYIAQIFFRPSTIKAVMAANRVIEPDLSKPASILAVNSPAADSSAIEKIILRTTAYSGVLLKVANPSRVTVSASELKEGQLLEELATASGAAAAINASGYKDISQQGIAEGLVIANKVSFFSSRRTLHYMIGFNVQNQLVLGKFSDQDLIVAGLRDAVEFDGPFLIVNGSPAQILGNGGGIAPRSAIGQAKDGTVLLLVLDGRQIGSIGATLKDVQDIMLEYGAVNAANLDGGSSVSLFYDGQIINSVVQNTKHRRIPCCFIVH